MDKNSKELWQYFLICFGFSWMAWAPFILNSRKIIEIPFTFLLPIFGPIGTFGPFVAAFFLTYRGDGKKGVTALVKRGFIWKFNKIWWIPILLFWPGLQAIALLIAIVFGGEILPEALVFTQPWLLIPVFLRGLSIGGPFGEEFGWRGYALDRLQAKWNALVSSLILGFFHAFWHLPLWFVLGPKARTMPFAFFAFNVIVGTIIYTWLYNNTRRSILPAIVFHTFSNMMIFPLSQTLGFPIYGLMIYSSILLVVIIFKPRHLVRSDKSTRLPNGTEPDAALHNHNQVSGYSSKT
jgi:uncharacterized protein